MTRGGSWRLARRTPPPTSRLEGHVLGSGVLDPGEPALGCCRPKPADRPGELDAPSLRSVGQSYPCSLDHSCVMETSNQS